MGNPFDPGTDPDLKTKSVPMQAAFATLAAVSWYNAIELVILIFVTFREYRGLYFWSLLISASLGLVPYSLGFMLNIFKLCSPWLYCTILTVGWYCMVTGQSVVLYSRLHLVLRNRRILNHVMRMICVNVFLLHVPTTVLTYGSNLTQTQPPLHGMANHFSKGYQCMEKIQMTGFCVQEFIISGLYIWETVKLLRLDPDKTKTKIMYHLVVINLIIICMDLGLLLIEYDNFYSFETMIKGVVYGIKLKLEFAVLGKLIHLVSWQNYKEDSVIINHYTRRPRQQSSPETLPEFVDATRVTSDLTHAPTFVTIPESVATHRRSVPGMDTDDISIAMFEHSMAHPSHEYDRYEHDLEAQADQKSIPYSHEEYSSPPRKSPSTGETRVASNPWEGDQATITNTNSATATTNPVDFTDSLERQRASGCLPHENNQKPD